MTRRHLLELVTAGCGGVALLGLGRALEVGLLLPARRPNEIDLRLERGLRSIVAAGVLAANPHDSQPWRFRLGARSIDVHLDLDRALGVVDPFLRQMHLGIGCALENVVIAATAQGLADSTVLFPDRADPTLAARVVLSEGSPLLSPHFDAIARRHTNRAPYERERRVAPRDTAALDAQVRSEGTSLRWFDADSEIGRWFASAILDSTDALIDDAAFMTATDRWFRWTKREVADHRDGPALDCAGLARATLIAAQLAPRPSLESYHRSWRDATRDVHLATAPMFGAISVRDAERPAALVEAGRLWQRVHLEATLRGLAMQPLDQWLELGDRARQKGSKTPFAKSDFAEPGHVPVMMFRIGSAKRPAPPSARRRLDDVIMG